MIEGQQSQFDAIIVGAGLMGSATAWSLSRRGRSVLLVEQYAPATINGSSHGSARIVRRAYGDALYTQLTGQAFELWRELEQQSGSSVLRMLGGVDFGPKRDLDTVAAHLTAQRVPHELMSAREAEALWPGMNFDGRVVFHPQAGTMDAACAVESFVGAAARLGAHVLQDTEVVAVVPGDRGAEVELASGQRIASAVVVVAAGAWIGPLLTPVVELPALTVTQQQIFHFPRLDPSAEPWPSVIHHNAQIYHLAGGRDGGPGEDRKIAEHHRGTPTTARGRSGGVDPDSRSRVVDYVKSWLPGLDPAPGREATCLYTSTPREDFVLDRIGGLVICSPCSGHGAKFAPLIGELTADLVTSPDTAQIPNRFRLAAHRPGAGLAGRIKCRFRRAWAG